MTTKLRRSRNDKMARILALANQKGGVGKTTSAINLGAAMAAAGRRVLLVDIDPQASLTDALGIDASKLARSIYDVLLGEIPLSEILQAAGAVTVAPPRSTSLRRTGS